MVTQLKKKRLRLYKDRLNILLDIAQTINQDHTIDDLLSEFEILLREELDVGKVLVYTKSDEIWENLLTSGVSQKEVDQIDVQRDLLNYTSIESITLSHSTNLKGFDAIIPLYHRFRAIGYVLIGDIEEEHQGISPTIKHLKLIQIISNLIIVFIENKRMQQAVLEQESIKKEMELASKIQAQLIPKDNQMPQSDKVDIKTFYHPHLGVGGDYYDVIQLSKNVIGFCIADVSGKGISAALLMSNFQAVFRTLFTSKINLKTLAYQLNERVNASANSERFITMFLGKYHIRTKKLQYINAGHLPPLLYDEKKNHILQLDKGCIGLGMLDIIPALEIGKTTVNKHSKLLAFTDGLVELDQGDQVKSGTTSLEPIISNNSPINENIEELKDIVFKHLDSGAVFDDVSIIGMQFK